MSVCVGAGKCVWYSTAAWLVSCALGRRCQSGGQQLGGKITSPLREWKTNGRVVEVLRSELTRLVEDVHAYHVTDRLQGLHMDYVFSLTDVKNSGYTGKTMALHTTPGKHGDTQGHLNGKKLQLTS